MANLIEKTDIGAYIQFTDNIPDKDIDPHITNVQNFTVQPLIDETMWTNIQTILTNPSHSFPELETFYETYIKPWVCFVTGYEFLIWHGNNITQFGVRVMNEETSVGIAPQDRAQLTQNVKNNGNAAYSRMRKALADADYTFDSIVYNTVTQKNRGNKTQISRIGGVKFNSDNCVNPLDVCPRNC